MKKFLLLFIAALTLSALSPAASAQTYRVDIDDPNNVKALVDLQGEPVALKAGLNEIDMAGERYLRIVANPGVLITELAVVYDDGYVMNIPSEEIALTDDGAQYFEYSSYFPEEEYLKVRTKAADDARTASFTLTIDDPAKADLQLKDVSIPLQAGANVIKFEPTSESIFELVPLEYYSVYSLTQNGQAVDRGEGYRYQLKVKDGDAIDVVTTYPDVDCAVTFTLTGDDADDFIREVDVNGRPALNWAQPGFTVKCGSVLTMRGRTDEYEVLSFTVNGAAETFSAETSLFIASDTKIDVNVRKYASYKIIVNIDDPARVKAFRGYINDGDEFPLQAGANTLEILRKNPFFTLQPAEDCYIKTLTVTGQEDFTPEELTKLSVQVPVVDDDVVTVTTAEINRNQFAMVYVYQSAAAGDDFSMKRADTSDVRLTDGYNIVPFYERDNSFAITNATEVPTRVYQNEEPVDLDFAGYKYYVDLADADVLKIFYDFQPAVYNLTVEADTDLSDVHVLMDRTRPIDLGQTKALQFTQVYIFPDSPATSIEVEANGEPLTPDHEGAYTLEMDSNKTLKITHKQTNINQIKATDERQAYDLLGRPATKGLLILPGIKIIRK